MDFVSSPSNTNEVNIAYGVSTANIQISPARTQVSTASTQVSTANLSDANDTLQRNVEDLGTKIAGTGIKTARRTINVEETSSKAMVAIDGAGFDWSYMADNEVPTNMALIYFSDSKLQFTELQCVPYRMQILKDLPSKKRHFDTRRALHYHQSRCVSRHTSVGNIFGLRVKKILNAIDRLKKRMFWLQLVDDKLAMKVAAALGPSSTSVSI
ncbi:hypothetical protein Tco_0307257 [Tanacetum coccineum]